MQKIKMSVCWMFMILVGCRLSHSTQSGGSCTPNEKLEKLFVPEGHNVTVPCPELKGEDMLFRLLKNEKSIFSCNYGEHALNCTSNQTPGVEALENRDNISVSFVLTGVNATSDGFYRCEASVTFPPPYDAKCGVGILVHIKGQCGTDCSGEKKVPDQSCGIHWIWIIALVSTYSIIATITAFIFWHKLRKIDNQSDYINTKPKAPRERRRKRGVHNPVPRHF